MKTRIIKLPLLGQLGLSHDRHGAAVKMGAAASFRTNLSLKVIRGLKYQVGERVVNAADLNTLTDEERTQAEIIEGSGYEVPVAEYFGGSWIERMFYKFLYRDGRTVLDLGSGLVTNVGVQAIANDWNWAAPSGAAINTIKLANWHATGTGTTAAAATDIALQTVSTQGGQTPVAGTQSFVSAANLQKYQSVATISYTGTEAVTEWGLHTASTLSATTGTPATATSATSLTATGTPYTASSSTVQGQQQHIVKTGTTTAYGLVLSNTSSVLTIPAWYKTTDGTASATPGATEAFTLLPVMLDHKVFSAVNVASGDSIQFTYALTVQSGG